MGKNFTSLGGDFMTPNDDSSPEAKSDWEEPAWGPFLRYFYAAFGAIFLSFMAAELCRLAQDWVYRNQMDRFIASRATVTLRGGRLVLPSTVVERGVVQIAEKYLELQGLFVPLTFTLCVYGAWRIGKPRQSVDEAVVSTSSGS
jgi:hypothetical protein